MLQRQRRLTTKLRQHGLEQQDDLIIASLRSFVPARQYSKLHGLVEKLESNQRLKNLF